jgi:hypothetical protein
VVQPGVGWRTIHALPAWNASTGAAQTALSRPRAAHSRG